MDLMKLDTPNLLLVWSPREDDPNVEQLFIEMVCTFIKNYALHETILNQVPAIMVIIEVLLYGDTKFVTESRSKITHVYLMIFLCMLMYFQSISYMFFIEYMHSCYCLCGSYSYC